MKGHYQEKNEFADKKKERKSKIMSLPRIELVDLRLCIFIEKMKSLLNDTRVYEKTEEAKKKTHPINKNLTKSEAKTCLRSVENHERYIDQKHTNQIHQRYL